MLESYRSIPASADTVLSYMCACVADGLSAFRNVNQLADPSPTATANHNVVMRINTVALAASGLVTPKCTSRKNTVASAVPRPPGMNDGAPANEANAKMKIATGSPMSYPMATNIR